MYLNIVEKILKQKLKQYGDLEMFILEGAWYMKDTKNLAYVFEIVYNGQEMQVFVEQEPYSLYNYYQQHRVFFTPYGQDDYYVDKNIRFIDFGNPIIENLEKYYNVSWETRHKAENIIERELKVGIYSL